MRETCPGCGERADDSCQEGRTVGNRLAVSTHKKTGRALLSRFFDFLSMRRRLLRDSKPPKDRDAFCRIAAHDQSEEARRPAGSRIGGCVSRTRLAKASIEQSSTVSPGLITKSQKQLGISRLRSSFSIHREHPDHDGWGDNGTFGFDRDRTSYGLQQIKKIPDKKSGIAVCTSDRSCDLAGTHTPGTNIHMAGAAVDDCLHTLHIGLPSAIRAPMGSERPECRR